MHEDTTKWKYVQTRAGSRSSLATKPKSSANPEIRRRLDTALVSFNHKRCQLLIEVLAPS